IDADGLADVVLGSIYASNNGRGGSGAAYVVFGKASTSAVDLDTLAGLGFRIDGAVAGGAAASALGSAGDVTGERPADLIAGAPAPGATFTVRMTDLAGSATATVSVTIAQAIPTISSAASSATAAGQFTDVATVSGLVSALAGSTVGFRLYAATDSACGTPIA